MSTSSTGSSMGGSTGSSSAGSHDYGKTYEPGTALHPSSAGSENASSLSKSGMGGTQMSSEEKKQAHSEGAVAKTIEQQTAKLPSDTFLWAALGSMGVSAALHFAGSKEQSRFVGQWVAPLLLFGVYNKIVKTQGSDRKER